MFHKLASTAFAFALMGQLAFAQIPDEATHVKSVIRTALQKNHLQTGSDFLIENAGEYYAATLPELKYIRDDGSYLDMGLTSLNISKDETALNLWKTTIALPTALTGYNELKEPTTKIKIGTQNIAGVWNENKNAFDKLGGTLEALKLEFPKSNMNAAIATVNMIHNVQTVISAKDIDLFSGGKETPLLDLTDVLLRFTLGKTLKIDKSHIQSTDYRIDASGTLTPDPKMIFGVSGDMDVDLKGLDYVLSLMQVLAADPNDPRAAEYRMLSGALEKLKAIGKVTTDENGFVHSYKLTTDPSGNIIINGQPAILLFLSVQ